MDHADETFIIEDMHAEYNTISLDDDPFNVFPKRESAFINLVWNRVVIDKYNSYDFSQANIAPKNMIRAYLL